MGTTPARSKDSQSDSPSRPAQITVNIDGDLDRNVLPQVVERLDEAKGDEMRREP